MSNEIQTLKNTDNAALHKASVSSSVSVPAVRVRFFPKDTDKTYDGTVLEETAYSYLVIPDDNVNETARWNKGCCDVLR